MNEIENFFLNKTLNERIESAILLSLYNGEAYLNQLLKSLETQTISSILFLRDDGSQDQSLKVANTFAKKHVNSLTIHLDSNSSQNIGVIQSFSLLLQKAKQNSEIEYFFFCDQDDIWLTDKVEKALAAIQEIETSKGKGQPILYHSDLELVDESGKALGKTFWKRMDLDPKISNSLARLLCQPTITGCSMAINRALAEKIDLIPIGAKMHDWWIGLVACCFGTIKSDPVPQILYRQHSANVIGSTGISKNRVKSHLRNLRSYVKEWQHERDTRWEQARAFLGLYQESLSSKDRTILEQFLNARDKSWILRKLLQFRYGFWQQAWYRNLVAFFLF